MREKFSIRLISVNEIPEVTNWARIEGFSPGTDDLSIYRDTDKQGVWVGCLDDKPIKPYEELYFIHAIEPIGLLSRHATHSPCLSVFL